MAFWDEMSYWLDAGSGYVHSLEATAANIHDITVAHELILKDDEVVYGDSRYIGIEKREEVKTDPDLSKKEYRINRRHKSVQRLPDGHRDWEKETNVASHRSAAKWSILS